MKRQAWALSIILCSTTLFAQEKPEPPRRQTAAPADTTRQAPQAQLPKIDLPEFVITGHEAIDLPEFHKTAIDEHKVYDASTRKLTPGQRESTRVQLGSSSKLGMGLGINDGFNGKVLAGYGSYQTPFVDGWFGKSFGSSDFLLKGGYRSSDGHVRDADFRRGHLALSGGLYFPDDAGAFSGNRVQGAVGYQGNTYRFYGSPRSFFRRNVNRFMGDVVLSSPGGGNFDHTTGFYVRAASVSDSIRTAETSMGLEFTATKNFDDLSLKGDIGLWAASYDAPSRQRDPFFTQFGLSLRYRIAQQLDVVGGGVAYGIRGTDTRGVGAIYPRLGMSWYASDLLTLFARFEPYIQRNSLSMVAEQNPYVLNDVIIRHPRFFHNLSTGLSLDFSRSVTAKMSFGYQNAKRYPIFLEDRSPGMWIVSYFGNTRIYLLEGEVYVDVTDRDHLAATAVIRNSRNSFTGKTVPYLPSFQASGLYQHRFDFGLTLGTTVQVIGEQYTDLEERRKLPSFTVVDVRAEYLIVVRLGIFVMLNNAFNANPEWWRGYTGLPRTIAAGMTFSW